MSAEIIDKSPRAVDRVIDRIRAGKLVIVPTGTVYGFVIRGDDATLVDRIYDLKNRDRGKPLSYFTTPEKAHSYGELGNAACQIISHWPAAVSVIVPKKSCVPDFITAGFDSVLLVCLDDFTRAMADSADFPLVATSANISGERSIIDFETAWQQFGETADVIVRGRRAESYLSSTIVNFTYEPPVIQRLGPIGVDFVQRYVPDVRVVDGATSSPDGESRGMADQPK
jgi:L-threonylcarbamoyladenylate synthase